MTTPMNEFDFGWVPMGKEEHAAWWLMMNKPVGHADLTIGDLPTEQVHPSRLLAELAEEFDRGIEI